MARSVDEIQQLIITDVQSTPELAAASSPSRRAIWRLWTYVVAVAINLLEQLMDISRTDVETFVSLAAPQTPQWLQNKIFEFQYDATNPQVLQLINFVPQYPIVDTTLRIVTRCSVKTSLANTVYIKVAKGTTPGALGSSEITALQTYVNTLGVAGIRYQVTSGNSDKLYVQAEIFYQGAYASVISDNVIAAINNYFATLPFDGSLKLLDLEIAIRNVQGVNDVIFQNVQARADGTAFGSGTNLVQSQTVVGRIWGTVAGYIVGETTSGQTLADTLTFIAE